MHKSRLIVAAVFLEMLLIPKTPCAAKIPIPKPFPEETGFYEMERENTEKGGAERPRKEYRHAAAPQNVSNTIPRGQICTCPEKTAQAIGIR